ncbi:MAG TPA: enoyl-CoA hydratase/isomerase family protein [Ilumatobacter sp.]|nr:enoyl-CoA hydratase/isomerase family protein [Ilumatobacter sp.]
MDLRHITVEPRGAQRRILLSGTPMTLAEARELEWAFIEIAEQPDVRVVVVGANGSDFCSGAADDLDPLRSGVNPAAALAAIACPVIVAAHGRTHSVGLEIALAADIRIADDEATFAMAQVDHDRLPCWGGTQRLPRLAGPSMAALMLLAAVEIDASQAHQCGMVQRVVGDVGLAVDEIATQLEALAPLALAATKQALSTGPEMPMRQALEFEGDLNHLLQTTADRAEGLRAFFDKRPARFEGR